MLPISILQASNKAVIIEWSTMESGFWFLDKVLWSNRIGKEVMIDNSFKYFTNYRDNWYCMIIVYVASFATYLNRGWSNLCGLRIVLRNIPLAKELLNVIEIIWGAIE